MHKYRLIAKKGEGTFSEVLKAQSIKNGKYFAIKCMKNHFDSIEQVRGTCQLDPRATLLQAAWCYASRRALSLYCVFKRRALMPPSACPSAHALTTYLPRSCSCSRSRSSHA